MPAPGDPRTRVGDSDREESLAALQRYVSEGYLTLDEFSDRSAAAHQATTRADLAAVTADLPTRTQPDHPAARRLSDPRTWSPAVIVAVVLAGVVLLAAAVMAVMMLGMMGGMGGMGGMR
jgi:hypothetical protein